MASITADSRFVIFRIQPSFRDSREARIKKKTPDQSPKDTLAWVELGKDSVTKIPRVKSYRIPELRGEWLAWLLEKPLPDARSSGPDDSLTRIHRLLSRADSLSRVADSLRSKVTEIGIKGFSVLAPPKKETKPAAADPVEEGSDLVLKNLLTGEEKKFPLVSEYAFSKNGNIFVVQTTRKNADSTSKALILWVNTGAPGTTGPNNSATAPRLNTGQPGGPDTASLRTDTVMKGFNDARNYAIDEAGSQLAFVAERDSASKALVKFYRLWHYSPGMDSAMIRADRNTAIVSTTRTISPDYANHFSKDGTRLFFGLAPVRPPKDTTLVDFETARLDVWNYRDDYLPPQQLLQLSNELRRSYLAMIDNVSHPAASKIIPLGDDNCEAVTPAQEGNGRYALGESSKGYRIRQQWEGDNLVRLYLIDLPWTAPSRRLVQDQVRGGGRISPSGKFILWYDWHQRNWFTYNIANVGKVKRTSPAASGSRSMMSRTIIPMTRRLMA